MNTRYVREVLAEWVSEKFPHLETFISGSNTHFFVIKKNRKCGSQGGIVAVVFEIDHNKHYDALGCLMKQGIWTQGLLSWRWDNHINITIENPNFFEVFENVIKQEDNVW